MSKELIKTYIEGHVKITDNDTGEILVDKANAIHPLNMAEAIARGLSNTDFSSVGTHQIYALALGNGGSTVDSMGQVVYLPPNVTEQSARLYNQTYFEVVDQHQAGTPVANSVTYQQSSTDTTSIVIVTMTIDASQPAGQDLSDTPPDPNLNSLYMFDELGLFTYGVDGTFTNTTVPTDSRLLSHIIFSPIRKTASRSITVNYTLTISCS